jgi:hypothetical protein
VPPLLLLSVAVIDRRRVHFLLFGVTVLLFTMGTFVSTTLFYVWPGMKFFRHVGLVSPLVRVLWCFVAGVGFEYLADSPAPPRVWPRRLAADSWPSFCWRLASSRFDSRSILRGCWRW